MARVICQLRANRLREGIPEVGASAVPAGGRIRSAPGRLGHHACRHYDRRAG
jgi:hypothetical protein